MARPGAKFASIASSAAMASSAMAAKPPPNRNNNRWPSVWPSGLKLLTPDMMSEDVRAKDLQYVLDQAFELCIRLKGKVPAFALAVQAQIELGGWLEYFLESREKSEKRLKRVSELYADRADEFIQASAKTWMRHKGQPCPLVIPGDKLVHFLVQVKRIDEAVGLVQAMVTALQEETRNLPLTKPQWA